MKTTIILGLLSGLGMLSAQYAHAQCHFAYLPMAYASHHRDSCTVSKPLVPSRWSAYMGLLGLADRRGTPYAGGDLEGSYWLQPRWSMGLRGTITGQMPATGAGELYGTVAQPRLLLYSVTWSNSLVLTDGLRWRLMAQAGAGVGGVNLYDNARRIPVKSGCGCTEAEKMASAVAPVTEVGLAATYKLRGSNSPWLTVRGGYRQWNGAVPFGSFNQFSAYVVSVGVSMPDAPGKRK